MDRNEHSFSSIGLMVTFKVDNTRQPIVSLRTISSLLWHISNLCPIAFSLLPKIRSICDRGDNTYYHVFNKKISFKFLSSIYIPMHMGGQPTKLSLSEYPCRRVVPPKFAFFGQKIMKEETRSFTKLIESLFLELR